MTQKIIFNNGLDGSARLCNGSEGAKLTYGLEVDAPDDVTIKLYPLDKAGKTQTHCGIGIPNDKSTVIMLTDLLLREAGVNGIAGLVQTLCPNADMHAVIHAAAELAENDGFHIRDAGTDTYYQGVNAPALFGQKDTASLFKTKAEANAKLDTLKRMTPLLRETLELSRA